MTENNQVRKSTSSLHEGERYYMIFAEDLGEIAVLLTSNEITYSESAVAVLSTHSKDRNVITLRATAQRFLQFVTECLSRRRVTVQIRDGDFIRNIELQGYSKDDALEVLQRVNDIFISKIDT